MIDEGPSLEEPCRQQVVRVEVRVSETFIVVSCRECGENLRIAARRTENADPALRSGTCPACSAHLAALVDADDGALSIAVLVSGTQVNKSLAKVPMGRGPAGEDLCPLLFHHRDGGASKGWCALPLPEVLLVGDPPNANRYRFRCISDTVVWYDQQ